MAELVSVIIPHFNRNDLIPSLINNVLDQDYRPLEILIIDDGSDIPLKDVEREYDSVTIRVLHLAHTGRPGVVRNAGIKVAKGEFIAFLDSDDHWLSGKLSQQMDVFNKNHNVELCHGNILINCDGLQNKLFDDVQDGHRSSYEELLQRNIVATSSVMARRTIFLKNEFTTLPSAQDYELWLRLSRQYTLYYCAAPLFTYEHRRNDSVSRKVFKRYLNLLKIYKLQRPFCSEGRLSIILQKQIASCYFKLAKYSCREGRGLHCKKLLLRSLRSSLKPHAIIALMLYYINSSFLKWIFSRQEDF